MHSARLGGGGIAKLWGEGLAEKCGSRANNASCHLRPAAWPQKPQGPPEQQWHFRTFTLLS